MLRDAMINSDLNELDRLLSPNLIFTNHLGQLITKSDDLNNHEKGDLKIENITLSDSKYNISDSFAIVSVVADISGNYNGLPANGSFRFTRVWVKNNNTLQVIAGHSCLIS